MTNFRSYGHFPKVDFDRRKSPEPRSPSPVSHEKDQCEHDNAGCYTLFGESQETKNLVSLIRTQAGLENTCP